MTTFSLQKAWSYKRETTLFNETNILLCHHLSCYEECNRSTAAIACISDLTYGSIVSSCSKHPHHHYTVIIPTSLIIKNGIKPTFTASLLIKYWCALHIFIFLEIDFCHYKMFEFWFSTCTRKSSNQNGLFDRFSVLIGRFLSTNSKLILVT